MFKLMTLNLNYYADKHGPWEQRLKQIRRAVEDHEPHIITLQAVKRDPNVAMGVDQARQLAGSIPGAEEVIFQPAQSVPDGSEHGSAILARLPCTESMAVPLSLRPGLDDTNERVLLYARFDLPDGPLHIFIAHFSWNDEQAADNVSETLLAVSRIEGRAILAGDLNQTPDKPSMARLRDAGWVDAWGTLKPDQPGYTFEADNPSMRIDYIYASGELQSALRNVEIIAPYPSDDTQARFGDHLALLATFDLSIES